MKLLLVEDNRRISQSLRLSLEADGYAIDAAFDSEGGQALAEHNRYDVILLDLMLPRKDGLAICRDLRAEHINTPILILSARDTVEDRLRGLDSGADDYLAKPFDLNALRTHLRALLHLPAPAESQVLAVADLRLDTVTRSVTRDGRALELTAKEYALLDYFMRNPDQRISREMVASQVWSGDFEGVSNVIDVYVRRLRKKVDDPFPAKLIETLPGAGYRLRWHLE
jgi:DNA-binding response OmpR family regulator